MPARPSPRLHQRGFTFLELVMVIILVSVLAVYASFRMQSPAEGTGAYQADLLARNIRHLQTLSISWGQALRLSTTATTYSVSCVTAGAAPCNVAPVIDPSTNQPFSVSLQNGVSLAGTATDFDSLGRPTSGATLLSAARTFTLTGDPTTWTVSVSPVTGLVSISSP